MKKIICTLMAVIVLCTTVIGLTSCFGETIESGKYASADGIEIEVVYDQLIIPSNEKDVLGTLYIIYDYFIDDGKITLTADRVEFIGESDSDYEERKNAYYKGRSESFTYEEVEGGFKMGGKTFIKK